MERTHNLSMPHRVNFEMLEEGDVEEKTLVWLYTVKELRLDGYE